MTHPNPASEAFGWDERAAKGIANFPVELASLLDQVVGEAYGVNRKAFVGMACVLVSDSCPQEAIDLLIEWVSQAERKRDSTGLDTLAVRFAEAIVQHQPD